MIRYSFTAEELRDAIEAHKPGWIARAAERARAAKKKGHVDEADAIWSEVKRVFATLQHFKCVYCEKPMPQQELLGEATVGAGAVEYDVEHYRPKNSVQHWPTESVKAARRITYEAKLAKNKAGGYARLAFDTSNYALSCKTCNTGHKRDYFPIAGETSRRLSKRVELDAVEKPLLLLPLGHDAVDPEELLGWHGPLPFVKKKRGHDALRARVCIDFFALDTRTDLLLVRATLLAMLWVVLEERAKAKRTANKRLAARKLTAMLEPRMYFAGCARAFVALYEAEPREAQRLYRASQDYLASRDPAVFAPA